MNSYKENDEERKKLLAISNSLGVTSEANKQKIISCKSKVETINDKILLIKNLLNHYEKKLEELMTEIANNEWNQIKAKTVLKADIQFVEQFKSKFIDNVQRVDNIVEDESITNKTLILKQEIGMLEMQCKTNDKIIGELYNEFQKLNEDC